MTWLVLSKRAGRQILRSMVMIPLLMLPDQSRGFAVLALVIPEPREHDRFELANSISESRSTVLQVAGYDGTELDC